MKKNPSSAEKESILVQEISPIKTNRHSPRRIFLVSTDKKNYFKITAPTLDHAVKVAMSIGTNSPPKTTSPSSPGKPDSVPSRQLPNGVLQIRKDQAELLVKRVQQKKVSKANTIQQKRRKKSVK